MKLLFAAEKFLETESLLVKFCQQIWVSKLFHMLGLASLLFLGAILKTSPAYAIDAKIESAYWYRNQVVVEILPKQNEGYILFAQRTLEAPSLYKALIKYNKARPVTTQRPLAIPLHWLKAKLRGSALHALYPKDWLSEAGWEHVVTDRLETLSMLALYFTGNAQKWKALARLNRIKNPNRLRVGQQITIPLHWLPDAYPLLPRDLKQPLRLYRNKGTFFARYRVKRGDTPNGMILRFTDRVYANEVSRLTSMLLKINRLRSAQALKAGQWIKMPIEWLDESYIVRHSRSRLKQSALVVKQQHLSPPQAPQPKLTSIASRSPRMNGQALLPPPEQIEQPQRLHVIIDAGHGGKDPGAVYVDKHGQRLIEHEVVYDIALRLRQLLRKKGIASYLLVDDPHDQSPSRRLDTQSLGKERVRVTPFYEMKSSAVAINMRIMAIHHLYQKLSRKYRTKPEHILLISIHGDALAASRRGAMVYYAEAQPDPKRFQLRGAIYNRRKEFDALNAHMTTAQRSQRKGKAFAQRILTGFRAEQLRISARKPLRAYHYRNGKRTLPGILRYSPLPYSVLVEVANLNNTKDRALLKKAATRQKVARALLHAVHAHQNDVVDQPIQLKVARRLP